MTVLEELEAKGLNVESSCRNGFCGMCRTKINPDDKANVAYASDPLGFHDPDTEILTCICLVKRDKIDLTLSDNTTVRLHSPNQPMSDTALDLIDDAVLAPEPATTPSIAR